MRSLCFLVLSSVLTSCLARITPFVRNPVADFIKHLDPLSVFTDHFAAQSSDNAIYLQTALQLLYSNSTVTVTQEYRFNILAFAANNPTDILIRPLEEVGELRRVLYLSPERRRDGSGAIAEVIEWGGWKVEWKDQEVDVIVASWTEGGYMLKTQYHLISSSASASKSLIHAVSAFNAVIRDAILVFDQGYWRPDHKLWQSVQGASWKDVILDQDFKDRVQKDYRSFYKSESTYKELQVPWKRGLIFLGPPGNGKTISLKAMMNDVGVPILYVKSLKSWQGEEAGIREVFQRARAEAPCLLVFEDLDSLINDANRSFFLNEVDGLEDNDGLLLVGTTNHFDRLDPALSSRPSRFDRKYTFPNPSQAERRLYAVYWQDKLASNKKIDFPDELLDKFAEKTGNFSFAYMKEVFVAALLTLAGIEDHHKVPAFSVVILDQIAKLREQLDEDSGIQLQPFVVGDTDGSTSTMDLDPEGRKEHEEFMAAQRQLIIMDNGVASIQMVDRDRRETKALVVKDDTAQ